MNLTSLAEIIFQFYSSTGLIAQVVILLSLSFTVSSLILAIVIIINRLKRASEEKKLQKFRDLYMDFLAEWAYSSSEDQVIPASIIKSLKNPSKRELFTNEILSLHSNLSGDSSKKLKDLFRKTSLDRNSLRKASSNKWDIKAKGIIEIVKMNITEGKSIIKTNLNSQNSIIAGLAQIAWIEMNEENTDSFLNTPGITLSDWWQISAVKSFKSKLSVPDFGKWIGHKNASVSQFAVRMCGIFKQYDNLEKIISAIDSEDVSVRVEAINAAGLFAMPKALEKLEERYYIEENSIKRKIIKAMAYISDIESLSFFNVILATEKDPIIRIMTAKALIKLGEEGEELLNYVSKKGDRDLLSIISHAKDKMI